MVMYVSTASIRGTTLDSDELYGWATEPREVESHEAMPEEERERRKAGRLAYNATMAAKGNKKRAGVKKPIYRKRRRK